VHPIAFDPTAFARALPRWIGSVPKRIAMDRAAPSAFAALAAAFPSATIVDAEPALGPLPPAATGGVVDDDEVVAPRRARALATAAAQGIDGWWLRTPEAIRLLTGRAGAALVGDTLLDEADVEAALTALPRHGRIAVDRLTPTERMRLTQRFDVVDAGGMLLAGSIPRAPTEVATLREGYLRTERAVVRARRTWAVGMTERECSDVLAREAALLGLQPHIDHVVTVIPRDRAAVPWLRGEWAGRAPWRQLTSERVIERGDLVGLDAGCFHNGYVTDFGATYIAGRDPTTAEAKLARRWTELADRVTDAIRPGATAADLRAAALDGWSAGEPPWPCGLYVAHGVGFGGVVPPFAGTDLGVDVERTMVLTPGDVLMIEPYVHEDGGGGFRAERCVAVTTDGHDVWTTLPIEQLRAL
jgi:Xaa-Pro aminopeptidase